MPRRRNWRAPLNRSPAGTAFGWMGSSLPAGRQAAAGGQKRLCAVAPVVGGGAEFRQDCPVSALGSRLRTIGRNLGGLALYRLCHPLARQGRPIAPKWITRSSRPSVSVAKCAHSRHASFASVYYVFPRKIRPVSAGPPKPVRYARQAECRASSLQAGWHASCYSRLVGADPKVEKR